MEPIIGGFLIIFVGLSYLKYLISKKCNRVDRARDTNLIQHEDLEIPPKYEEIDILPKYTDV